jgi:hypothetical protein
LSNLGTGTGIVKNSYGSATLSATLPGTESYEDTNTYQQIKLTFGDKLTDEKIFLLERSEA